MTAPDRGEPGAAAERAEPETRAGRRTAARPVDVTTVEAMLRHRLAELLGGWRGALETAVPTIVFVGLWMWRHDLTLAVQASLVAVAALVVIRLLQRQTVQYAFSSVFATVIAAVFALRSGQAEDAFLPGILWNVGSGSIALISVLARWPLLGFLVAAGDPRAAEDPSLFTSWRRHPGMVAVCSRLTLVLVVLFLGRVAIMLPLYFAAQVGWLGVAKLALGWPAYLLAVVAMGAILVRGQTPLDDPGPHAESTADDGT